MSKKWLKHKEIDYLYLDYRGLDDVGFMNLTLEFTGLIRDLEDKSLYLLIDGRGLNVTYKNYTKVRDIAKAAQPKIYKTVYVGLNSYSKALYNVYKRFTGSKALLLDTIEEALEYFEK